MEVHDIGFSDTLTPSKAAGRILLLGLVDILLCHLQSKDQFLLFLLQAADLQFQIFHIGLERRRRMNLQMKPWKDTLRQSFKTEKP